MCWKRRSEIFSFGELSRLVETNDSYITQLNTYTEAGTGLVIVTIKINKIEVSDIVATFQQYDYVVRYYFGREEYANELKKIISTWFHISICSAVLEQAPCIFV